MRFFLHCDGRATPLFDAQAVGRVTRLANDDKGGQATFDAELSSLVASAAKHKLVLQIVLWSFDLCRSNGFPIRSDMLREPANALAYLEAGLVPLLRSLERAGCSRGRCLIEIMNEPECCIDDPRLDKCPGQQCVSALESAFVSSASPKPQQEARYA